MAGKIKTLQITEGVETTKPTELTNLARDLDFATETGAAPQAEVGKLYLADATSNTITFTLPVSPSANDMVGVRAQNLTNAIDFGGLVTFDNEQDLGKCFIYKYDGSAWVLISDRMPQTGVLKNSSTPGLWKRLHIETVDLTENYIINAPGAPLDGDRFEVYFFGADNVSGGGNQFLNIDFVSGISAFIDGADTGSFNVKHTSKGTVFGFVYSKEMDRWLMDKRQDLKLGGTTGQVLTKSSDTDLDADWADVPKELPAGGTADQVLAKVDGTDYNVTWVNQSGGGGGGGLTNDGVTKTGNFTIADGEEHDIDSSGGSFTITVPNVAAGVRFAINDKGGALSLNPVTVQLADTTEVITMNVGGSWLEFSGNITDSDYTWKGPTQAEKLDVYTQTKFLASPMNTVSTGDDILVFNNLTIGRKYEYTGKVRVLVGSDIAIRLMDGATELAMHQFTTNSESPSGTFVKTFTATSTTLTLEVGGISGSNNVIEGETTTYGQLTEFIPYSEGATTSLYHTRVESTQAGPVGSGNVIITVPDLVIGKAYEIDFYTNSSSSVVYHVKHNGVTKEIIGDGNNTSDNTVSGKLILDSAEATTVTLEVSGGTYTQSVHAAYAYVKEYLPLVSANATATQAGLVKAEKTYRIGTAYTNGTPTMTLIGNSGLNVVGSALIPYQTVDGTWRLKGNIQYDHNSSGVADFDLNGGFTFPFSQAVAISESTADTTQASAGTNDFVIRYTVVQGQTRTSFDVEISAKPSWAD